MISRGHTQARQTGVQASKGAPTNPDLVRTPLHVGTRRLQSLLGRRASLFLSAVIMLCGAVDVMAHHFAQQEPTDWGCSASGNDNGINVNVNISIGCTDQDILFEANLAHGQSFTFTDFSNTWSCSGASPVGSMGWGQLQSSATLNYTHSCTDDATGDFTTVSHSVSASRSANSCNPFYTIAGSYPCQHTNTAPTGTITSPATNTEVFQNDPVSFSSSASDTQGNTIFYEWRFGDGGTGSGSAPTHTYTTTGFNTVDLYLTDGDPEFPGIGPLADSISLSVVVGTGPPFNLSIAPTPATPHTSDTVTFTFSADDPDDATLDFHIAFGDANEYISGPVARGTPHTTTHQYPTPGVYPVVMTVFGGADTTVHSFNLTVINEAPVMSQIIVPTPLIEQQPATFTVSAFDAENDPMTYNFDYGDGTNEVLNNVTNGQNFTHTYATPGNYTVSFFAFDALNPPAPAVTANVVVADNLPPATASITTDLGPDQSVDMATLVNFTVSATDPENDPLTYHIDFGDFTEDQLVAVPAGSSQTFTHSYAEPASITVLFSAFDTANPGSAAVNSVSFEVKNNTPPHTLSITSVPPTTGFIDQEITFNLSAIDGESNTMEFKVAFGDGNVSTPVAVLPDGSGLGSTSIKHRYTASSGGVPYTATLFVNDLVSPTNVQIASTDITIGTDASPVISGISLNPVAPKINEPVTFTATATDADSPVLTYTWTFSDDNSTVTDTTGTATHTYADVGSFDVTVSVTDGLTPPVTLSKSVSVGASDPIAGLDPDMISEGQCLADSYNNGSDPISHANGNVYEREVDYVGSGPLPLRFERYYNSTAVAASALGGIWRHNYERSVSLVQQNTIALVTNGRGTEVTFRLEAGAWVPAVNTGARLAQTASGWTYTRADSLVEQYDSAGKLTSITDLAGHSTQLAYNTAGQLDTVTDSFNRTLVLGYNGTSGLLETVTDPATGVMTYSYLAGKLSGVTYADTSTRAYHYEDPNVPNGLTRIVDENNQTYVKFVYDSFGRGQSSSLGGDMLTKNTTSFQYIDDFTTIVTDGLGQSRTFKHEVVNGIYRTLQHDPADPECTTCGVSQRSTTYDAAGSPDVVEDFNGTLTDYDYDPARGLEIQRIEALGTLEQRTTITQWHPTYRLRTCIIEDLHTTALSYTAQGQLESRTIIDTTAPALFPDPASKQCDAILARPDFASLNTRAWGYTYVATGLAAGMIETIDGPRTDVTDVTTYTYDPATGYLKTVSNALNQVTEYLLYDAHGRPQEIKDLNGRLTKLTYNRRNQVTLREVGNVTDGFEVTENVYDPAGNLDQVNLPNGAFIDYVYDAAHRLTDIYDQLGNHIQYELDALGNRKKIDTYDAAGVLKRTHSNAFTAANRLDTSTGAGTPPQVTDYVAYDGNGNLLDVLDPEGNLNKNSYDKLGRLTTELRDANVSGVSTQYTYDTDDRITSVTDANNNVTTYEYDGLGNLKKKTSPDSGVTDYTDYDGAGNLLSRIDANMKLTTYTYDVLNRIDLVTYDNASTADYAYDTGVNAIGRLSSITDSTGSTAYGYDYQGRLSSKTQTIGTVSLTVGYHYDALGNLDSMSYPSGEVVKYSYDATTKLLSQLSLAGTPTDTVLLQGLVFDPFGPLTNWSWGNGVAASRSYDLDGQVSGYDLGSETRTLTYYPNGNVNTITDPVTAANNQSYGYDAVNRLTDYSGGSETRVYGYDANGNRDSLTVNGTAYTNVVTAGSNRLDSVGGPRAKVYSYDLAGNVTGDGVHSYQYDDRGRMISVDTTYALYAVNTQGQRVKVTKVVPGDANGDHAIDALDSQVVIDEILNGPGTVAGNPDCNSDGQIDVLDLVCINVASSEGRSGTRLFVYDEVGHLVGEYTESGAVIREYVWVSGKPMVVLDGGAVYYVYNDHLNTPRAITTGVNNTLVWRWHSDAFGTTAPQQDPDGDGQAFEFNLRFPGQYFDSETGLHYNYFRFYDPSIGRYITSDPIGLASGVNTYAYVGSNPLIWKDPYGLEATTSGAIPQTGGISTGVNIPAWARHPAGFIVWSTTFSKPLGVGSDIVPSGPYYNEDASDDDEQNADDYDGDFDKVEEEYDSLEAAVGSVNPLDDVEFEGKTKNPGLCEQGFTEKWTGVDSDGVIQSAFKNPDTSKWTGGHESSKNDKYW